MKRNMKRFVCLLVTTGLVVPQGLPSFGMAPIADPIPVVQPATDWKTTVIVPLLNGFEHRIQQLDALDRKYPGLFTHYSSLMEGHLKTLASDSIAISPTWTNVPAFKDIIATDGIHLTENDVTAYTYRHTGTVYIYQKNFNRFSADERISILMHELEHTFGGDEKAAYLAQYAYLRVLGYTSRPGALYSEQMVVVVDQLENLKVIPELTSNQDAGISEAKLDTILGLTQIYSIVKNGLDKAIADSEKVKPVLPSVQPSDELSNTNSKSVKYMGYQLRQDDFGGSFKTAEAAAAYALKMFLKERAESGSQTSVGTSINWTDPERLSTNLFVAHYYPFPWDGTEADAYKRIQGQKILEIVVVGRSAFDSHGKKLSDYWEIMSAQFMRFNGDPVITNITVAGDLIPGRRVMLHADVTDPEQDTTTVRWFFKNAKNEYDTIGWGRDLSWYIPLKLYGMNLIDTVYAVPQDSKFNIGEVYAYPHGYPYTVNIRPQTPTIAFTDTYGQNFYHIPSGKGGTGKLTFTVDDPAKLKATCVGVVKDQYKTFEQWTRTTLNCGTPVLTQTVGTKYLYTLTFNVPANAWFTSFYATVEATVGEGNDTVTVSKDTSGYFAFDEAPTVTPVVTTTVTPTIPDVKKDNSVTGTGGTTGTISSTGATGTSGITGTTGNTGGTVTPSNTGGTVTTVTPIPPVTPIPTIIQGNTRQQSTLSIPDPLGGRWEVITDLLRHFKKGATTPDIKAYFGGVGAPPVGAIVTELYWVEEPRMLTSKGCYEYMLSGKWKQLSTYDYLNNRQP